MNMQQFGFAIGYVSQDLIPQKGGQDHYMYFGLTTRKNGLTSVYMRCVVYGDIARQFAEQHSKGSIVCLFGQTYANYNPDTHNRVNNLFEVKDWFYFADIDAHFDDLSEEEYDYLSNRLVAFRQASVKERKIISEKIKKDV